MSKRGFSSENPLRSLSDIETDLLACLACGMTVGAAAKVAGLGIGAEGTLVADARFRSLVRASAAHLATITGGLPHDPEETANVIMFPRQ
jgi:hypothetical protein